MSGECVWVMGDPEDLAWETSCGRMWQFIDGGPTENGVVYCPYCGARVKEDEEHEREDEQVSE